MNKTATILVDVQSPAMAAIRKHSLFGDDLCMDAGAEQTWLHPQGDFSVEDGRLQRRYVSENGMRVILDWGRPGKDAIRAIADAAHSTGPAAVRSKWSDFLHRIGKPAPLAPETFGQLEISLRDSGPFTAARRPSHPEVIVDRLMIGDRAYEAERIDAILRQSADVGSPGRRANRA